jgi:hypothetical protein
MRKILPVFSGESTCFNSLHRRGRLMSDRSTHTGRPLGTADFVTALERSTLRLLAPQKGGRPKKPALDSPGLV